MAGTEDMKKVVEQTKFYKTPEAGIGLLTSGELRTTMNKVLDFCVSHQMVTERHSVGYGDGAGPKLLFNPGYMKLVQEKK